MTQRIALATAAHYPELAPDDQVLRAAFRQRGLDTHAVVWDSDAAWESFDVVVTRSIWDYHLKYARFRSWLDELDAKRVPVHNPTDVLRHNSDKRYMVELERAGIRITPTEVVGREDSATLAGVMRARGWEGVVVKPTVASTGYETWMATAPCTLDDEARFAAQHASMDLLVQEFATGVKDGELSFVFIAGEYQHCIIKKAAGDEFRVHIEHGGTVDLFSPSFSDVEWARSVMETVEEGWTYGRVDAVRSDDGLMVMELELLDPELFFLFNPGACQPFIDRVLNDARK